MKLEYSEGVITLDFWRSSQLAIELLPQMIKLLKDHGLVHRGTLFKFSGLSQALYEPAFAKLHEQLGFMPKAIALEKQGGFIIVMSSSVDFQVGSTIS